MALHFATPSRRGGNQSDDGALGSAWIGRETEGGVDFLLVGFGAAGFAEMDSPTVSALQGGGDPDLVRQGVTNGVPGVVDALGFELQADGMHGAVGQQADEQVTFNTTIDSMVHRAQSEVSFQRPEHRLKVGQHGIDPP